MSKNLISDVINLTTVKKEMDLISENMKLLEVQISRQQKYIKQFGVANDLNPDKQWEKYKTNAELNLKTWDQLTRRRDHLKKQIHLANSDDTDRLSISKLEKFFLNPDNFTSPSIMEEGTAILQNLIFKQRIDELMNHYHSMTKDSEVKEFRDNVKSVISLGSQLNAKGINPFDESRHQALAEFLAKTQSRKVKDTEQKGERAI